MPREDVVMKCICPDCHMVVHLCLNDGGNLKAPNTRWCPYCSKELYPRRTRNIELTVCIECPEEEVSGGSKTRIYHHSLSFCPKCGQPLERMKDIFGIDHGILSEDGFEYDNFYQHYGETYMITNGICYSDFKCFGGDINVIPKKRSAINHLKEDGNK